MLLNRVKSFFAEVAPLELGESWDNVGVLVENPKPNGSNIIGVTIDLTPAVLEEFIGGQQKAHDGKPAAAEVIIAYHPPIFASMKRLTLADPKQNIVLNTIANGTSIYSPHTCLDSCRNSINDWLIEAAVDGQKGLVTALAPITPDDKFNEKLAAKEAAAGGSATPSSSSTTVFDTVAVGAGRIATFSSIDKASSSLLTIEAIVANMKKHLGVPTARVSLPHGWAKDKVITKMAVCAGSGSGLFKELRGTSATDGIELLVTGEMGHHDVLAANDKGRAVVLFEHTNTERGYLKHKLVPMLKEKLGGDNTTVVVLSALDKDPLVVW